MQLLHRVERTPPRRQARSTRQARGRRPRCPRVGHRDRIELLERFRAASQASERVSRGHERRGNRLGAGEQALHPVEAGKCRIHVAWRQPFRNGGLPGHYVRHGDRIRCRELLQQALGGGLRRHRVPLHVELVPRDREQGFVRHAAGRVDVDHRLEVLERLRVLTRVEELEAALVLPPCELVGRRGHLGAGRHGHARHHHQQTESPAAEASAHRMTFVSSLPGSIATVSVLLFPSGHRTSTR